MGDGQSCNNGLCAADAGRAVIILFRCATMAIAGIGASFTGASIFNVASYP